MSDHPILSNPPETSPGAASAANPAEIAGAPSTAASAAGASVEKADDVVLSPAEIDALRASAAAPVAEAAVVTGAATASEDSDVGTVGSPGARSETISAHPLEAEALPRFDRASGSGPGIDALDMLYDVNLQVTIELGRTRMLVEDVLKLGEGSVVELDRLAGDPVDIYANERLIARGEILVLNDNFCVRVSEVLTTDPHRIGAS